MLDSRSDSANLSCAPDGSGLIELVWHQRRDWALTVCRGCSKDCLCPFSQVGDSAKYCGRCVVTASGVPAFAPPKAPKFGRRKGLTSPSWEVIICDLRSGLTIRQVSEKYGVLRQSVQGRLLRAIRAGQITEQEVAESQEKRFRARRKREDRSTVRAAILGLVGDSPGITAKEVIDRLGSDESPRWVRSTLSEMACGKTAILTREWCSKDTRARVYVYDLKPEVPPKS